MMINFWKKLHTPFFVLAPMADVTDVAFRQIMMKYSDHGEDWGGPDVFWTEFVSCDGICSPGREIILRDLEYDEKERPIVAQIFGSKPENIEKTSALIQELGFDGIDINMGCPDRGVEKQGAGAALIKNPNLAKEIIAAARRGAGNIPVSVKTRIGYNQDEIDSWIRVLLDAQPDVLTVHARTRKEMSKVPARWEDVKRVVDMAKGSNTLVIGNGDVESITDAKERASFSGADGVMIGRGVFGNPWFFNTKVDRKDIPLSEQLRVMVEHTKLFEEKLGDIKNFAIMKKHYKAYVNGFDGAKELRIRLMDNAVNSSAVEQIVNDFIKKK